MPSLARGSRRALRHETVEVITIRQDAGVPARQAPSPRYLYADENGQLQFADSMENIPPQFRKEAQRLDD